MASKKTSSRSPLRLAAVHISCAIFFIAAIVVGSYFLKQYVERRVTYPSGPARIVLKERPVWMSDMLANQITQIVKPAGVYSAFDKKVLVDATEQLKKNPWVKHVRAVRRVYGNAPGDTIEIDAEYRAPVAMVRWGQYFWLIDGEGVKLPEQFSLETDEIRKIILGRDGRMNIRVIEGVKRPPVEAGKKWTGDDITAALDLVKLLYGKPYAEDIICVNVANFGGRVDVREAQLVLKTRHNTEVRWGRPIDASDYYVEVTAAQKLDRLRKAQEQYGRVDGRQTWIDIRFDKITYPLPEAQANTR